MRGTAFRLQGLATSLALLAAVVVVLVRSNGTPLRMNDYQSFGEGQSLWQVSKPMAWVVPVPAFNEPVRIRSVQLRPVDGSRPFDRPDVYLLRFHDQDFYGGATLSTEAGVNAYASTALHRPDRLPLDRLRVNRLDSHLSIVVSLNFHEPGCHEAQLVFNVSTADGAVHTLLSRWYVAVDTGISEEHGLDMCGPPRPRPTVSPTTTTSG